METLGTLWALEAGGALDTLDTLGALRPVGAGLALHALEADDALRSLGAGVAIRALGTLEALGTLGSRRAILARETLGTLEAGEPLGTRRAGQAGRPLGALEAGEPLGSSRSRRPRHALGTLGSVGALESGRTSQALRTRRAGQAGEPGRTLRSLHPGGAGRSGDALGSLRTVRSSQAGRTLGSLGTLGSATGGTLDTGRALDPLDTLGATTRLPLHTLGTLRAVVALESLRPDHRGALEALGALRTARTLRAGSPGHALEPLGATVGTLGSLGSGLALGALVAVLTGDTLSTLGTSSTLGTLVAHGALVADGAVGPLRALESWRPRCAVVALGTLGTPSLGTLGSLGSRRARDALHALGALGSTPCRPLRTGATLGACRAGDTLRSLEASALRTLEALGSLRTHRASGAGPSSGALDTLEALRSRGTLRARRPHRTLRTLGSIRWSLWSLGALGALDPVPTGCPLETCSPGDTLEPLRTLGPRRPVLSGRALGSSGASEALDPLGPLETLVALRARRTLRTLGTLVAERPLQTLGPGDPLGPLGAVPPLCTLGTLMPLGALGASGATGTDCALHALRTDRAGESLRTRESLGTLGAVRTREARSTLGALGAVQSSSTLDALRSLWPSNGGVVGEVPHDDGHAGSAGVRVGEDHRDHPRLQAAVEGGRCGSSCDVVEGSRRDGDAEQRHRRGNRQLLRHAHRTPSSTPMLRSRGHEYAAGATSSTSTTRGRPAFATFEGRRGRGEPSAVALRTRDADQHHATTRQLDPPTRARAHPSRRGLQVTSPAPAPTTVRTRPRGGRSEITERLEAAIVELTVAEGFDVVNRRSVALRAGTSIRPAYDRYHDRAALAEALWSAIGDRAFDVVLNGAVAGLLALDLDAVLEVLARWSGTEERACLRELLLLAAFDETLRAHAAAKLDDALDGLDEIERTKRVVATTAVVGLVTSTLDLTEGDTLRSWLSDLIAALGRSTTPQPLPDVDASFMELQPIVTGEPFADAMLNAALNEIATTGYRATTMDRICARAGVSEGSVFARYASKLDLVIDIVERRLREAHAATAAFAANLAVTYGPGITEAVVWRETWRPAHRAACCFSMEIQRVALHEPRLRARVRAARTMFTADFAETIEGPHQADTEHAIAIGIALGDGLATMAVLYPNGADLPFDVVTTGFGGSSA